APGAGEARGRGRAIGFHLRRRTLLTADHRAYGFSRSGRRDATLTRAKACGSTGTSAKGTHHGIYQLARRRGLHQTDIASRRTGGTDPDTAGWHRRLAA